MSQCGSCNCSDFTLNKTTGEMTCSVCGSANYIGSPTSYMDGAFDSDDSMQSPFRREEFMTKAIFSGTKE